MNQTDFFKECEHTFSLNHLEEYITAPYMDTFYHLTEHMLEANQKMNLTALRDEKSVIARHIADCLLAAKHLPKSGKILDVGSGGGMPALPFAIVRPDLEIIALDATAKKMAYVETTAEALNLKNIRTITGRAEELGADLHYRERFDMVCARAVAELRILLEWCIPFAKNGGMFLALKGKNASIELTDAKNAMQALSCVLRVNESLSLLEENDAGLMTSERHNLLMQKTKATNRIYPRRNALITKSPL